MNNNILRKFVKDVPNYPQKGVMFYDISPALFNSKAFRYSIIAMGDLITRLDYDFIVGIDARGFLFASALAIDLKKGLVLCRKKGKLPGKVTSQAYKYEYSQGELVIQSDKIIPGKKYLIIDDVLATGNTCLAAVQVLRKAKAVVTHSLFFGEICVLHGEELLTKNSIRTISLLKF